MAVTLPEHVPCRYWPAVHAAEVVQVRQMRSLNAEQERIWYSVLAHSVHEEHCGLDCCAHWPLKNCETEQDDD